jgi:hypothetical protein
MHPQHMDRQSKHAITSGCGGKEKLAGKRKAGKGKCSCMWFQQ